MVVFQRIRYNEVLTNFRYNEPITLTLTLTLIVVVAISELIMAMGGHTLGDVVKQ